MTDYSKDFELHAMIEKIKAQIPMDTSDFSIGYHSAYMYFIKYFMGKDPFEDTEATDYFRNKALENKSH